MGIHILHILPIRRKVASMVVGTVAVQLLHNFLMVVVVAVVVLPRQVVVLGVPVVELVVLEVELVEEALVVPVVVASQASVRPLE
jgi:hypothetical protein